jgi:hypothetical protein
MPAARDLPRVSSDARVAASVTLLAVVICASAAFALTPRAGSMPVGSVNRLAQASPPPVIKIVNATPRSERCEEQTWPYFDRRCLPLATQSPLAASMPASAAALMVAPPSDAAQPAKPSASPATARQVTGGAPATQANVTTAVPAATTGIAPRDESALSPVRRAELADIQRRDQLLAQWEAEEAARRVEEERPPEPRRRKARRHYHHQFGFFGLGFRF